MNDLTCVAVLLLAFLLDALCGDPPNALHPVAWMGNFIGWARQYAPDFGNLVRFVYGAGIVFAGTVFVATVGLGVERVCREFPWWVAIVIQVCVLKSAFSVRTLANAAESVTVALAQDDLVAARRQLAYHLVSRDVSLLNESQVAAAAIESVAENTSDSCVAPLFFYAIAGLPGALVYRFVNTCDAMLGYRTRELQWLGKPAARIDDLLNLIPARMTAVVMIFVYGLFARRIRSATTIWLRDHRLTASPNAGHPMSAAAGVLGVMLSKQDHYVLGQGQPLPDQAAIKQSVYLLWVTCTATLVITVASLFAISSFQSSP